MERLTSPSCHVLAIRHSDHSHGSILLATPFHTLRRRWQSMSSASPPPTQWAMHHSQNAWRCSRASHPGCTSSPGPTQLARQPTCRQVRESGPF